jgi:hypothetical protein
MDRIEDWVEKLLISSGVAEGVAPEIRLVSLLVALGVFSTVAFWITRTFIPKHPSNGMIYWPIIRFLITWLILFQL